MGATPNKSLLVDDEVTPAVGEVPSTGTGIDGLSVLVSCERVVVFWEVVVSCAGLGVSPFPGSPSPGTIICVDEVDTVVVDDMC